MYKNEIRNWRGEVVHTEEGDTNDRFDTFPGGEYVVEYINDETVDLVYFHYDGVEAEDAYNSALSTFTTDSLGLAIEKYIMYRAQGYSDVRLIVNGYHADIMDYKFNALVPPIEERNKERFEHHKTLSFIHAHGLDEEFSEFMKGGLR